MAHNDRRHAIDTYFRIVQQHSEFAERTQETFNSIESHVYDLSLIHISEPTRPY